MLIVPTAGCPFHSSRPFSPIIIPIANTFISPPSPYHRHPGQSWTLKGCALFSAYTAGDVTTTKQVGKKNQIKVVSGEHAANMKILRALAEYLCSKDNPELRFRVIMALGFLVGAKALKSSYCTSWIWDSSFGGFCFNELRTVVFSKVGIATWR